MGWIETEYDYATATRKMVIKPHKTDMDMFRIVKIRQEYTCHECQCKIPKASYVFGNGWFRLCLGCGEKFTHKGIKAFEDIINLIKNVQVELLKNKEDYEANNTLAKL